MKMRTKVSAGRLKAFAKEERITSKLYSKLGFKSQARQEASHAKFFSKKLKGLK